MMGVIKWNLLQRRWSVLWWCVGIAALIGLNLAVYPSFRDQAAELEKSLANIPESVTALFSDTGEFVSPIGYLSSQVFYFMLPMLLGIMAISLGSSLVGREEREGTIELLLSRPISRSQLLLGKGLVGLCILTFVTLCSMLLTIVVTRLVKLDVAASNIMLASFATWLLVISFGSIAFMLSAMGKSARGAAVGISSLFALGGYIAASLTGVVEWLHWPSKIFPFTYFKPAEILAGNYNWNNIWVIVGFIVVPLFAAWLSFRRRDIV